MPNFIHLESQVAFINYQLEKVLFLILRFEIRMSEFYQLTLRKLCSFDLLQIIVFIYVRPLI